MRRFWQWVAVSGCLILIWLLPVSRRGLADVLFSVARLPATGSMVGWGFEQLTPLLPLERVLITDKTAAFNHPRPSWQTHILIVPRKQVLNVFRLAREDNQIFLEDVWRTAHDVFSSQHLDAERYALLVNGGIRQDVKQVHFHLHQPRDPLLAFDQTTSSIVMQTKDFTVYQLAQQPQLYLVLVPTQTVAPLSKWTELDVQQLSSLELPLDELEQRYALGSRGFSLVIQEAGELERQQLVIWLTAGTLR